jgi:hypothetical protein
MTKDELKRNLFDDRTRLFCVLDGAAVPKLPVRLYEARPANHCLFPGELEPDMVYVAPYLVHLAPDNEFTDWVLENCSGKNWGIFFHSQHSMTEMRKHFRGLVKIYDENAKSYIFRFYDPRVLRKYLPTCTPQELEAFFGKVTNFFAENEEGKSLLNFRLDNDGLKVAELE